MKKILIIATMAVSLSGISAFAQGYFALGGAARSSWDIFTPANNGTPRLANTMTIGILWGASTAVSDIGGGTPTNAPSLYAVDPWAVILGDGEFQFAVDNNTGLRIAPTTAANSGWAYTTTGGFSAIPVTGTTAGTQYKMMVIGWDKNFATPQAAALASAAIGWSSVFNYTPVSSIGTPTSLSAAGFTPFGVNPVPEPGTFALAGLGIAAMLVARRRK